MDLHTTQSLIKIYCGVVIIQMERLHWARSYVCYVYLSWQPYELYTIIMAISADLETRAQIG